MIYTCEEECFSKNKTHFDTNHHLTVVWKQDHLEQAYQKLKMTIRATLPDKAKLTDEEQEQPCSSRNPDSAV